MKKVCRQHLPVTVAPRSARVDRVLAPSFPCPIAC
jgi:hypothetical protein